MSATLADFCLAAYVILSVTFDDGSLPVQVGRLLLVFGAVTELMSKPFTRNLVQVWQIGFIGFAALSIRWATSPAHAEDMARTLVINGVCVVAIVYLVQRDARRLRLFLFCLMIAPVILMARVASEHGVFAFLGTRAADATSANIVGMTAAFAFCLSYLGFAQGILASRFVCGSLLVLNFAVVLLSASRKALLVVGLVILLYSLFDQRSRGSTRLMKFAVALGVTCVGWWLVINVGALYELVGNRLETMVNGFIGSGDVDASTTTRINLIDDGMTWFQAQPWLGHGADNFRVLMQMYHPHWAAYYAHNNFVELLVDYGVVGFALFYWMYAVIVGTGLRRLPRLNPLQTMTLCLMISLMVAEYGFVDYFNRVFMAFVAVAWVAICTDTLTSELPHRSASRRPTPKAA